MAEEAFLYRQEVRYIKQNKDKLDKDLRRKFEEIPGWKWVENKLLIPVKV